MQEYFPVRICILWFIVGDGVTPPHAHIGHAFSRGNRVFPLPGSYHLPGKSFPKLKAKKASWKRKMTKKLISQFYPPNPRCMLVYTVTHFFACDMERTRTYTALRAKAIAGRKYCYYLAIFPLSLLLKQTRNRVY